MSPSTKSRRRIAPRSSGFTLLEVMSALLVLSIGLLGLAALQIGGLRAAQQGETRTRAVQAAADMAERMRANPAGMAAGLYEITRHRPPRHSAATGRALTDLIEWRAGLGRLPGGLGEITRCSGNCGAGTQPAGYTVTVWWNETRGPAARSFNCPPRSALDLRCVRLLVR